MRIDLYEAPRVVRGTYQADRKCVRRALLLFRWLGQR